MTTATATQIAKGQRWRLKPAPGGSSRFNVDYRSLTPVREGQVATLCIEGNPLVLTYRGCDGDTRVLRMEPSRINEWEPITD